MSLRLTTDEDLWDQQLMEDPVFREVNLAHLSAFAGGEMVCTCQYCVTVEA